MKRLITIISLCLMVSFSYTQQTDQVGTSMANFLKIGVGSRAVGMGDAFIALANDASALYWNPAGIAGLSKNEVLIQTTSWIAGSNLYYLGVAVPFGNLGTLGASVNGFSSGDMEETTLSQPNGTGRSFNASNLAIGISYAKTLTDHFSVGFTVKYINESLSRESADAFAFDIGSTFTTNFLNNMKLGIALSNLGSQMELSGPDLIVDYDVAPDVPTNKTTTARLGTQSWDLPLVFRIGLGTYIINTDKTSLSLEVAVNDTRDFEPRYNTGGELSYKIVGDQKILFRAGYKVNYDEEGFTTGGGLMLNLAGFDFKFDYSFADFNRLGNIHRYSISILF
jgi:hypothetical protein